MKTKKEIFRDILISAQSDCVLKIKLKNEPNPVITAVERVQKNKVILKPTCLYGYKLRKRTVTLLEIEGVTRYHTRFDNPIFQKIRYIKNNIAAIRQSLTNLDNADGSIFNPNHA